MSGAARKARAQKRRNAELSPQGDKLLPEMRCELVMLGDQPVDMGNGIVGIIRSFEVLVTNGPERGKKLAYPVTADDGTVIAVPFRISADPMPIGRKKVELARGPISLPPADQFGRTPRG